MSWQLMCEINYRFMYAYKQIFADVITYNLLINIRVNPQKRSPYAQIEFKSWKAWLIWAICASFSSLHAISREIEAIESCKNQ